MPRSDELICRKCGEKATRPVDIRYSWCPSCKLFQYEICYKNKKTSAAPPIELDKIVADIQRSLVKRGSFEPRCQIVLEQFQAGSDPTLAWRAVVMDGKRVEQHSRRAQFSPQDALRELHLLCKGVDPEDI